MKSSKKYDMILDALQELMEDKDIRSISVSEIAKKAGIGKGSIYYYFPSKDAILDALVERSYHASLETAKNLAERTELSPFIRMALLLEACRSSSTEFLKREMMIESQNKNEAKQEAARSSSTEFLKREIMIESQNKDEVKQKAASSGKESTDGENADKKTADTKSADKKSVQGYPFPETGNTEQNREQAHVHRKFLTYVISELKPVLAEIIQQGIDQNLLHFDDPAALSELVLVVLAVKLDNYLIPSAPQETERTLRALTTLLERGTGIPAGTLDFLTVL